MNGKRAEITNSATVETPSPARAVTQLVEEGAAFESLMRRERAAGQPTSATPNASHPEHYPVIVIGAGQAGLSTGYHLARLGIRFAILEANDRVGDTWRKRWDSLRLFTAAKYDALDGLPFPAPGHSFPTKDEMADYLEGYARRFQLPVHTGVRVERLTRENGRYVLIAGTRRYEADHVVVAMATFQKPKLPELAARISPEIVQLHSLDYQRPSQIPAGDVLIVGGGNSGAEIALELSKNGHRVWLSGRDTGAVPFRLENPLVHRFLAPVLLRGVFHRLLTTDTPMGRRARPHFVSKGAPLIRVKPRDLAAAGVERVARTEGARGGKPELADGRVLDVKSIVWCSGFHSGLSWIDLPLARDLGEPAHRRGVVENEPGLYFVGLNFLYAMSSTMIHGAGRDARHIANVIAARVQTARRS